MFVRLHPQLAGNDERNEKRGAESEDAADAGVLCEDSGEHKAEDLRAEDRRHKGGTDATHEFGWGFLLHERL